MINNLKKNSELIFILLFLLLLIFNLYYLFIDNKVFAGAEMANKVFEIGKFELEVMYVLKPIFNQNLSFLNILIINFYFISITYLGNIILKSFAKKVALINNFISKHKEFFFISSFVLGSIIFNGFLRLISLNFSITTVNFIVITFLIISLFSFINILFFSWKTFFNKKLLFLILLFIFFLINNIQIDGHHLSGDSFYHYGYKTLIINFLKLDFIPIIGGHYFEPLLVTPITFILQDFFFFNSFEQSVFISNWFFQAYAKTSSFFLLYLSCKYFYNNEKIFVPIILVLLLFFTNYSGNFLFNPLLYDSGNPLALSLHGSRAIGLSSFVFITIFVFEKLNNLENKKDYSLVSKTLALLIIFMYLIGVNSLGIQFIFLNLLFISFFFINSFKKYFLTFLRLKINFKIFIILFPLIIFLSYVFIGRIFSITHFSSYTMLSGCIVSIIVYYLLALKLETNSINKKFTASILIFCFFSLIFLGNFLSYYFLFGKSEINFSFIIYLNDVFSNISLVNSKIPETGLYNSMIEYEKNNKYILMNICSFKDKIELFMTGMPNYHCFNYTRLIFGSGLIFLFYIYNSIKVFDLLNNSSSLSSNFFSQISIYLYLLSTFYYILSLFYSDMISGSYLLHSRTRFIEVASFLILFNFVILFSSNFDLDKIFKKIIIILLIIKFTVPFSINVFNIDKYDNWYLNQWIKNFIFLKNNF